MSKTAAFILLLAFFCASPAFRQLYKIPVLFVHYHEHQHEKPGISFWQYLKLHYQGEEDNGRDEAEDQQLPFKSAADGTSTFYIAAARTVQTTLPAAGIQRKKPVYTSFVPSGFAHTIFHPPRLS
jgi:hypothetical protein